MNNKTTISRTSFIKRISWFTTSVFGLGVFSVQANKQTPHVSEMNFNFISKKEANTRIKNIQHKNVRRLRPEAPPDKKN